MPEHLTEPNRSSFACRFCKKRKVKCDRTLPNCSICQKTQQQCDYPSEAGRPGPKLGTTRRKRPRLNPSDNPCDKSSAPDVSDTTGRDGCADGKTEVQANASLLPSAVEVGGSHSPTFASYHHAAAASYPLTPVTTPLDVRTLAYIMHPSHDTLSYNDAISMKKSNGFAGNLDLVAQACSILKVPTNSLQSYLDLYFNNMTSFSLFHRPSFTAKLYAIASVKQLVALLASIFAFSARHRVVSDSNGSATDPNGFDDGLGPPLPPKHFEDLSLRYVDEALAEYSVRSPPLCILQALILQTFSQLIKGIRGAAWRRAGVCVRVAYELHLHHVDRDNTPEQQNPDIWCRIEERRRAWWAIWEMDVFASMIKRCPAALDSSDNETRLPVCDEDWFARRFSPSCFLEKKPMQRLKELQICGTQSPKAWFIVLNSFMREGHILSKFRSPRPGGRVTALPWMSSGDSSNDNTESLAILANSLRCFGIALPKHLRFRHGFLSFPADDPAARQLHSAKYSIHVTTQLTRMMIHHQDAYRGAQQDLHLTGMGGEPNQDLETTADDEPFSLRLGPAREGLQQFIEAADELLRIVSWSSEEQVRYVNPFQASIIWYGAVVHLGWKVLAPPRTNLDWIESKFSVMHMILVEFSDFWDLPKTLQVNLASVEGKLRLFTRSKAQRRSSSRHSVPTDRDSNHSLDVMSAITTLDTVTSPDHQTRNKLSTSRSIMPPGSSTEPENHHPYEQSDHPPAHTPSTLAKRRDTIQEEIPTHSETIVQELQQAANTAGMGGIETRHSGDNDNQYGFEETCMTNTDLVSAAESYIEQDTNNYQPRGLWDDLTWDLDFAMDPGSLFRGIMDYNN